MAATQRPAGRTRTAKTAAPFRLAVTLLALLTFVFQGYVTQTHIHKSGVGGWATASFVGGSSKAQPGDKYPANQDPSNCPICQEILHSGSFVTPNAVPVLLPSLAVSVVAVVVETALVPRTASHSWRGRAPPRI